jgi:transcriptional regulator with XRE-family HTH domain
MEYEIGIRLREVRKKLNLTQMRFGKKIGVSDVTISTTESGKTPLTEANIKLICLTFNINETWLRTGQGTMFNEISSNPEESEVLGIFERLSPEGRKMAKEYSLFLLNNEIVIKAQVKSPALSTAEKEKLNPAAEPDPVTERGTGTEG